jgi:hypothetical protein
MWRARARLTCVTGAREESGGVQIADNGVTEWCLCVRVCANTGARVQMLKSSAATVNS